MAVPKEHFRVFLRKAEEFGRAMEAAFQVRDWNAAASAAAHCVVSACDAVVAHHLGIRCKAQDHREITRLLELVPGAKGPKLREQVLAVLDLRLVAEYQDRDVAPREADLAVRQAERVLAWAKELVPA